VASSRPLFEEIPVKERNEMSTKWTSNQLQAINKKDKNILVAAAARKR